MQKFYNVVEAAAIIGASPSTINTWINNGHLPAERDFELKKAGKVPWRIKHGDLMEAARGTKFAMQEPAFAPTMLFDDPDSMTRDAMSLRVWWPLEQRSESFSLELLTGYTRFRAVTYSVSIPMIYELLTQANYDEFQVIFGSEKLVRGDMRTILGVQAHIREGLAEGFLGIGGLDNPKAAAIMDRIAEGKGQLRAMHDKIAHSKIYLLDGNGQRRVILGSANLSETAFMGRQGEIMTAYDDDDYMWAEVDRIYNALLKLSSSRVSFDPTKPVSRRDAQVVPLELPLFNEIMRTKEPVTIYAPQNGPTPDSDEALAVSVEAYESLFDIATNGSLPKPKGGVTTWTPALVKRIQRNVQAAKPPTEDHSHELRYVGGSFMYNGTVLERPAGDEFDNIQSDADLFTRYINNFSEFEDGFDNLQRDYFAVMSWLFFSPFMPRLKKAKADKGPGDYSCKMVAILYGESNCGKTDVVEMLLSGMFGPTKYLRDREFTRNQVLYRQGMARLYPLFYDDIQTTRFTAKDGQGTNIVKSYDSLYSEMAEYPCIIASLNSDTIELPPEVRKRCLTVYTDSPLPMDDVQKTQRLQRERQRINNRIGTFLYREYLYRMDQRLPTDPEELAQLDYLATSSSLLVEMFEESLRVGEDLPTWCESVTTKDFDESYWGRKRDDIKTLHLDPELWVSDYPPRIGNWTTKSGNYVIGVNSMRRNQMMKTAFPPQVVNRRGSVGDMIFLNAHRLDEFMRRGDPSWKTPVPKAGPLRRMRKLIGK